LGVRHAPTLRVETVSRSSDRVELGGVEQGRQAADLRRRQSPDPAGNLHRLAGAGEQG